MNRRSFVRICVVTAFAAAAAGCETTDDRDPFGDKDSDEIKEVKEQIQGMEERLQKHKKQLEDELAKDDQNPQRMKEIRDSIRGDRWILERLRKKLADLQGVQPNCYAAAPDDRDMARGADPFTRLLRPHAMRQAPAPDPNVVLGWGGGSSGGGGC